MKNIVSLLALLVLTCASYSQDDTQMDFNIKGKITDSYTGKKLSSVTVSLILSDGRTINFITRKNGKFKFNKDEKKNSYIEPGYEFKLSLQKKGFKPLEHEESTKGLDGSETFELNFVMERLKNF